MRFKNAAAVAITTALLLFSKPAFAKEKNPLVSEWNEGKVKCELNLKDQKVYFSYNNKVEGSVSVDLVEFGNGEKVIGIYCDDKRTVIFTDHRVFKTDGAEIAFLGGRTGIIRDIVRIVNFSKDINEIGSPMSLIVAPNKETSEAAYWFLTEKNHLIYINDKQKGYNIYNIKRISEECKCNNIQLIDATSKSAIMKTDNNDNKVYILHIKDQNSGIADLVRIEEYEYEQNKNKIDEYMEMEE